MEAAETGSSKVLKLCVKNNPPDLSSNEQEENSRCDLATWLLLFLRSPLQARGAAEPVLREQHILP